MIDNPTLQAIRERRSVHRFVSEPISDEQLEAILEAGRWAPSALNSQPWDFVVVADPQIRSQIGTILEQVTLSWRGFAAAPAMIVVAVSPLRDPNHYAEDGAIAAQNMCLAAHSMGLASSWAGVYAMNAKNGAVEKTLKDLLGLPRTHRVIAVIPVGTAAHVGRSARRPLAEIVHRDRFHPTPEAAPEASTMRPF
jgi:nitroreductase